jgi:hypothetical protein
LGQKPFAFVGLYHPSRILGFVGVSERAPNLGALKACQARPRSRE